MYSAIPHETLRFIYVSFLISNLKFQDFSQRELVNADDMIAETLHEGFSFCGYRFSTNGKAH